MIISHIKIALRHLARQKGYSFIKIMGLTIGMACFILIGLWVRDELSFDQFHQKKERIFRILNKTDEGDFIPSPTYALAPALKSLYPEVEEFSRVWFWHSSLVKYRDKSFEEDRIYMADPGFFRMFSFPFVKGEPETALADRKAIVLTEDAALRYFDTEDPIGKVLYLAEDRADFTVTGVIENIPPNSHMQFDFMIRVEFLGEDRLARWEEWTGPCYILLRKDASASAFTTKIADIYKENVDPEVTFSPVLQSLTKVHLYEFGVPGSIKKVYVFSVIAIFILIMACINFINLTTARSAQRAKEVGMRKVIGALRSQIMRQFLGEALVVAFFSLILAVLLVEVFLPQFNLFTGKSLAFLSLASLSIILTLILTTFAVGLLAGSYPALFLSSFQPVHTLKGQLKFENRGSAVRKILIVFQFAISVGLITCTLIVSRQLNYIQRLDIGLNRENVVILLNNPELRPRFELFKDRLQTKPGIKSVTSAAQGPTWVGESISIDWEGNPSDDWLPVDYTVVDYDFFKTFGMEITQGRSFSPEFATDIDEACIINELAAKRMGLENPIGTSIYMGHPAWEESFRKARVIGVVKDFHDRTLRTAVRPFVFRMYRPWHQYIFIKIDRAQVQEALGTIENTFKTSVPGYPYRFMFYDEAYNRQYMSEHQLGRLFNVFSLLSIVISCLGLFGLAAYTAEQRTKEIGIRKILGASILGIVSLTTREFLKWVAAANLVAWPVAYLVMSQWLRDFAYKVSIGPLVYCISGGLTLIIALFTVSFQSIKAAQANPVDSLRYE
ncbi:MAG: FtsX-like permease family protein [Candidatus Aminicenantes bacterium]|nr:FtsX-like permease family protein [Candidatus Aminicenantes bacterium]